MISRLSLCVANQLFTSVLIFTEHLALTTTPKAVAISFEQTHDSGPLCDQCSLLPPTLVCGYKPVAVADIVL